jgi:chromosome segregation ATPase
MSDTTDIEKKSLEAHVELCAERYRFLEEKIVQVEESISSVENTLCTVHQLIQKISEKRNDQIIAWGLGIMAVMLGIIGWLASKVI